MQAIQEAYKAGFEAGRAAGVREGFAKAKKIVDDTFPDPAQIHDAAEAEAAEEDAALGQNIDAKG